MHSVKKLSANKIKEIVKLHKKKYRDDNALFLAEGMKSYEEIKNSGIEIVEVYSTKQKNEFFAQIVSEEEMKKISTTSSACEILTIAKKKTYSLETISKNNRLILLDSISDPGNLGTIIRSAAAFNVEGIILFGDCVEYYSPKVIRSCAGNFFKIPIIEIKSSHEIEKHFKLHTKIATSLKKENTISIKEAAKLSKYIIMFGSEAKGLANTLERISDKNIILDMEKGVESLNLSVSASIIMYELFNNM